jgi:hypothetical protein
VLLRHQFLFVDATVVIAAIRCKATQCLGYLVAYIISSVLLPLNFAATAHGVPSSPPNLTSLQGAVHHPIICYTGNQCASSFGACAYIGVATLADSGCCQDKALWAHGAVNKRTRPSTCSAPAVLLPCQGCVLCREARGNHTLDLCGMHIFFGASFDRTSNSRCVGTERLLASSSLSCCVRRASRGPPEAGRVASCAVARLAPYKCS